MNELATTQAAGRQWPDGRMDRIPAWIYSDPDIFEREMQTFHFGPTWNFVGLECEIPSPGSFKRSWVGPKSVIMVRDKDGEIHLLENRCAHRGSRICWSNRGVASDFTCPYHHWNYDLQGNLQGLPFLRGARGKGGMPKDFDKSRHGLRRLSVAVRNGVVWGSFDERPPALEDYLGEEVLSLLDRVFSGRPLRLLGYNRQSLPANWKFYFENSRDPYHATLLHTFFVTFGLLRTDTPFKAVPTEGGRHGIMASTYSAKSAETQNEITKQMRAHRQDFKLNDPELVKPVDEFGDSSMIHLSIFPSIFVQQHGNSLAMRHIVPKDVSTTELSWTFFGYEDDDDDMRHRRLKQANLLGPAGYVAVDDGEVVAQLQRSAAGAPESVQVVEMGGHDSVPQETMLTETLIRGFYAFYREHMGL